MRAGSPFLSFLSWQHGVAFLVVSIVVVVYPRVFCCVCCVLFWSLEPALCAFRGYHTTYSGDSFDDFVEDGWQGDHLVNMESENLEARLLFLLSHP